MFKIYHYSMSFMTFDWLIYLLIMKWFALNFIKCVFYETFSRYNIKDFNVVISGKTKIGNKCRIWTNILDRKDASFIVRYKLYEVCYDFKILVEDKITHKKHINSFYKGNQVVQTTFY